jgi:hypothetical protein
MPARKRTSRRSSKGSLVTHDDPMRHEHRPLVPQAILDLDLAITRTDVLTRIIAGLTGRMQSPWLIIVVRFSDDRPVVTVVPGADRLSRYKRVFTGDGRGELNVVDYFLDMSHGLLDLSKSTVVGPYRLLRPRADYVGNVYPQPEGKLNRNGILDLAKATAVAKGIDLSKYAGVVVCGTPTLDLCGWPGGMAALCDDDSLQPSLLGQELAHGYGADHSGRDGSTDEYADAWDTMSTAAAHSAPHAEFGSVGPGLNAWNMRLRGWLDESRVVTVKPGSQATVTLRPLHDRPFGTIAIDVQGFLVEFRLRDRWDAAIPRSCALVHRVEGNRSYLMASKAGGNDLGQGDRFEWGSPVSGGNIGVDVLEIDEAQRSARIGVQYAPIRVPEFEPSRYFGGVEVGGGGFRITPRGIEPVPPREPVLRLLHLVARYGSALEVAERYGSAALQLEALGDIAEELGRLAGRVELTSFHPGLSFSPELGRPLVPSRGQADEEHDTVHTPTASQPTKGKRSHKPRLAGAVKKAQR